MFIFVERNNWALYGRNWHWATGGHSYCLYKILCPVKYCLHESLIRKQHGAVFFQPIQTKLFFLHFQVGLPWKALFKGFFSTSPLLTEYQSHLKLRHQLLGIPNTYCIKTEEKKKNKQLLDLLSSSFFMWSACNDPSSSFLSSSVEQLLIFPHRNH